jgi:predicted dehydrogenase/nucleoside-diphosphate-sugar epimerase
VGLLGAGYIVDSHATALQALPGVQLTAVCDKSLSRARSVANRYGIEQVFGDVHELMASNVDVVHILLPPDAHAWGASQALAAGKHVLLEKPMCATAAQCHELVSQGATSGRLLGVSHNFLFGRAYEGLRRDVREGIFGPLDHLTVNWLVPLPFVRFGPFDNWIVRETRNSFVETAPHLLAFVFDLLGGLDDIQCHAAQPVTLPTGVVVYRKWSVTAQRGPTTVSLNLAMTDGYPERVLRLRGRAGSASYDFDRDLVLRKSAFNQNPVFDHVAQGASEVRQFGAAAVSNFVRAVRGTLAKTAQASPYAESFQRSLSAFYAGLASGTLDARLDASLGARILDACEQAVDAAGLAAGTATAPTKLEASSLIKPAVAAPEVLVLGGSGFIGRHLVSRLTARGLGVRVVSRNALAAAINLRGLPVEIEQGHIGDESFLRKALRGIHTVYHLAKTDGKNWAAYQSGEVDVTQAVAKACSAHGVKRFIYTGTIDSYDAANPSNVIDNSTPLDARIRERNHYAHSKAISDAHLLALHKSSGFPVVILRPGVVIGRGCPPAHWGVGKFVSESVVQYWGDGENKIPLVLVEDVAEALLKAYDTPGIEGQSFLVTDKPLMSARDYVAEVQRLSGMKINAQARSIASHYIEDVFKEAMKYATRHPNRRPPSKHDWACRALASRFDSSGTERALQWRPQGTREALVEQGIRLSVEDAMR